MNKNWLHILPALFAASSLFFYPVVSPPGAIACTEVLLNKSKGLVISGRTLDYDCEMGSQICFRAKGSAVSDPGSRFTRLQGAPLQWTAKYSAVMVDAFNEPAYVDGMNTEGLSVGTLWHSDTEPAKLVESGKNGLANVSLVEYILENAKNIDEAKQLVSKLSLVISIYKGKPMALHWIVTERSGRSLVIELKDGKPKFFEEATAVEVLANSPSYNMQLDNLKACQSKWDNESYVLPGDYQSKSRFVKSAFLVAHLPEFKTADEGVSAATQILHNVESPRGAQGPNGSYTQWMVVRDQSNLKYLVMGVKHSAPKVVDLRAIDFAQLQGRRLAVESTIAGDVAQSLELKSAQAGVSN
jgi:choloylglycine hydrolase